METKASPLVERLYDAAALLISVPVLGLAYWLPFALTYKTYVYWQTGVFHLLGEPTPIGMFNRYFPVISIAALFLGLCAMAAGKILRRREKCAQEARRSARTSRPTRLRRDKDPRGGSHSHDNHPTPLAS